jgi:PAS domain S-box-containing protein
MANKSVSEAEKQLRSENEELFQRLTEAEETLFAIRNGEVDAIVVSGAEGARIFSLTSAETPYRIMVEEMHEGAATLMADTTIIYCNSQFAELVARPAEQIVGASFCQFIGENEKPSFTRLFNSGLVGKSSGEITFLSPENEVLYFYLSFSPLTPDVTGDVCVIMSDFTERKKAEELRISEEKYKAIFEQSAIGKSMTSVADGKMKLNKAFCDMLGYSEAELSALNWQTITHPDDLERDQKFANSLISGEKESAHWEKRYIHKNGNIVWVDISTTVQRDKGNNPLLFNTSIIDITRRNLAEQTMREKDIQFRKLLSNVPDMVFQFTRRLDGTYCVPIASEGIRNIYGCSPEDVIDDFTQIVKLIYPEDSARLISDIEYSAEHFTLFSCEYRVQLPDQEIKWLLSKSTPELLADGSITWYGFTIDISERKLAEDKLNITLQNLERSNKDLEQFTYVANHDLQEPLRMISSYTQLLERKYKDKLDQDANDYIQFAVDGAIRLQKLLNDLLEFSKVSSHSEMNEQVGTSSLLGQVISNLQQLIRENTALITNDDLPVITANEAQIMRLFQNLIENAIKFKKKMELPKIHISCTRQKNMYQFSVADNGIGMEMQYHDRVFTIFQRLHSVKHYPGTGMGLSICKRIVERHGGTIWFESTVNAGTTFYFTIPVKTSTL